MKRIFLTGASSGIGRATAQALVASGHEVWGTSRNLDRLPKLDRFHSVQLDLRDANQIESAFSSALREAGAFDVVINNAGSGHFGPAELLSPAELNDQFQVLFFAQVRLLQLAVAHMRARDTGLIINVTSLASRLPVPFMAAYNAAKAALAAFIFTMQLELGRGGVRLMDLQPADINTEFNDGVVKGKEDQRYTKEVTKTWEAVDRNMKAAPPPSLVARRIVALVEREASPPRLTVGGVFQAQIAPLIFRILPQQVRIWGLKLFYGL
jgi:NAD(P)-dependent dehydrogenase (short-subunit alcohol dehydrogenase family)